MRLCGASTAARAVEVRGVRVADLGRRLWTEPRGGERCCRVAVDDWTETSRRCPKAGRPGYPR